MCLERYKPQFLSQSVLHNTVSGYPDIMMLLGCLRNKASAKNLIFWSHVKKRALALALALGKASEKGPLALALPSLALTQNKR